MENLGLLTALSAALVWGSYIVPFKMSPSSNLVQFQALMTIGIFLFALVVLPFLGYPLTLNIYGITGGVLWASANAMSLKAVTDIGLSRAMPIWVSVVILVSFLWGAIAFQELPAGLMKGLVGIVLIILGVVLVGSTGNVENKNIRRGILLSVLAGALFGSQLMPLKVGNLSPSTFFFPMSVGIVLFGVIFFLFKQARFKNEAIFNSLLAGGIWSLGNLLSIIAVSLIGLAKGFPLTQSAVLIAVFWGLFYFKEITQPRHKLQVLVGAVILLSGVIILGSA